MRTSRNLAFKGKAMGSPSLLTTSCGLPVGFLWISWKTKFVLRIKRVRLIWKSRGWPLYWLTTAILTRFFPSACNMRTFSWEWQQWLNLVAYACKVSATPEIWPCLFFNQWSVVQANIFLASLSGTSKRTLLLLCCSHKALPSQEDR